MHVFKNIYFKLALIVVYYQIWIQCTPSDSQKCPFSFQNLSYKECSFNYYETNPLKETLILIKKKCIAKCTANKMINWCFFSSFQCTTFTQNPENQA
jgi:hypothetical protein